MPSAAAAGPSARMYEAKVVKEGGDNRRNFDEIEASNLR
jgi:hypothetical protein